MDIGEERLLHDPQIHSPLAVTSTCVRVGKFQRPQKLGDPSTVIFVSEGSL
jgi:hypothetical protein